MLLKVLRPVPSQLPLTVIFLGWLDRRNISFIYLLFLYLFPNFSLNLLSVCLFANNLSGITIPVLAKFSIELLAP